MSLEGSFYFNLRLIMVKLFWVSYMNEINMINKRKNIFMIMVLVAIAIALLTVVVVSIAGYSELFPLGIIIGVLEAIILYVVYYYWIKLPFKNEIVRRVLTNHKEGLIYTYKVAGDSYTEMIKTYKLISSATSFKYTDKIIDTAGKYKYSSMDLLATHTQSTGKTTTTITDFKGKFFMVEGMEFPCNFILKEERFKRTPAGFEFLDLESIDFNTKFNLYVKDDVEVFKIFTPKRIESVLEIEKSYDNILTVVALDNILYILSYDNSNQFEDENQIIEEYEAQLKMINDYIDVFENKWKIIE